MAEPLVLAHLHDHRVQDSYFVSAAKVVVRDSVVVVTGYKGQDSWLAGHCQAGPCFWVLETLVASAVLVLETMGHPYQGTWDVLVVVDHAWLGTLDDLGGLADPLLGSLAGRLGRVLDVVWKVWWRDRFGEQHLVENGRDERKDTRYS